MTTEAIAALTAALEASEGLPVPTAAELARRVEHQLAARGYEVVRACSPRGDAWPTTSVYLCTCPRGCLAHPFGSPREMSP